MVGRATRYEVRIAYDSITEANWGSATILPGAPQPGPAGSTDSMVITGLYEGVTYHVAMKACDEVPNWSPLSNNGNLLIPVTPVNPDFNADPLTGTAPLTVQFTDLSTGNVVGWFWNFGDGSVSSVQNPQHTYSSAGSYTVSLTAWNTRDTQTVTRQSYISVNDPVETLVAAFSADPLTGIAPVTVQFTDLSSGTVSGWLWDFGDGSTSYAQNPQHTYDAAGSYTVNLTVWNTTDTASITRADYIFVDDLVVDGGEQLFPTGGSLVAGTIEGGIDIITDLDNQTLVLREETSGGKPDLRYSLLEYNWTFDVPPSTDLSFHVYAGREDNPDNDDFIFEYSVNGGAYRSLVMVNTASVEHYQAYIPSNVSGPVTIRVVDSDRSEGNRSLDLIGIDQMYIERNGTTVSPDTIYVDRIETGQSGNPAGKFRAEATVYIVSSRDFPASGVEVFGHFEGVVDGESMDLTGTDGSASFQSKIVHYPEGEWTFFVDSLRANGRVYSSGLNLVSNATGKFDASTLPHSAELYANYPNPFNPGTSISFWIPESGEVTLSVYNSLGQKIATLLEETLPPGNHAVTWDASGFASGVYFYRLEAGDVAETRKMILMK
jgi:PKD repeat protein